MSEYNFLSLEQSDIAIIDGDRGKNYPKQEDFVEKGFCLFLNTKNVREDGFDFSNAQFISKAKDDSLRKGKLQRDDIVLTTRGTLGNIGFYNQSISYNHIRINSGMVILRCGQNIDPKFIYLFLKSSIFKNQVQSFQSGSAQPQLPIKDLKCILIPDLLLSEQKQIADILSCLDNKIDNLRRQNETLEKIAQTLFKHWFIDFEFPNDDGKPYKSSGGAMVASELGDIPEGWRVGKLEELIIVNPRESIKTGAIVKYVDMRALSTSSMEITDYVTREFTSGSKFRNQDTLLARITPCLENGKTAFVSILDDGEVAFGSTEFIVLRAKENCCSEYIYPLARSPYFRDFAVKNMTGSSGRQRIPNDVIANYKLAIPDIQTIKNYQKICRPLFWKTSSNQQQIQTLTKTRDALLPKLMSGQIRIKEAESIIEEVK
ncbi:putative Type I restriction-modification system, S subunit [Planktothrix sp. PCC 11201]|uniref:restriction endonuclease subunit S n=1 Tax=Planktothrix sp. PCC 11201 TaxID=1729650 RepID=UPI00091349D5|nr:restriction endonuclease subunit S [Planktothrix sp. PCC 11201]SKB11679.1 putative Type I restriction-modification system, S subunit [Planktothrix sp. PCC 11201]